MRLPQSRQLGQSGQVSQSLYGLKQVKKLWNKIAIKFFQKLNFDITNRDFYFLIILDEGDFIIVKI